MNERAPHPPNKRKITSKYKHPIKKIHSTFIPICWKAGCQPTELSLYIQKSGYTPAPDPCTFTMSLYANMAARTASSGIFHPAFPENVPSYWVPNSIGTIKTFTGTNTQLSQTNCRDNDLHDSFHIVTQLSQFPAYLR